MSLLGHSPISQPVIENIPIEYFSYFYSLSNKGNRFFPVRACVCSIIDLNFIIIVWLRHLYVFDLKVERLLPFIIIATFVCM